MSVYTSGKFYYIGYVTDVCDMQPEEVNYEENAKNGLQEAATGRQEQPHRQLRCGMPGK